MFQPVFEIVAQLRRNRYDVNASEIAASLNAGRSQNGAEDQLPVLPHKPSGPA